MSSSGGGIVVKPFGLQTPTTTFTKTEGQEICDCLSAHGYPALAAQLQPIVDAAS